MKKVDITKISKAFSLTEKAIRDVLSQAAQKKKDKIDKPDHKKVDHSHLYFLSEDLNKLEEKIEILHLEIDRLGKAIGLSCDVSGETFHDNFDYEECSRQQAMWSAEIRKLNIIKRKAKIVQPKTKGNIVAIGRTVSIDNNGKKMTIKIGSYMTFNAETVSYDSPIVKLIYGANVGDEKEGVICNVKTKIKILEVN